MKTRRFIRGTLETVEDLSEFIEKHLVDYGGDDYNPNLTPLVYAEYPNDLADANKRLQDRCKELGYILWTKPYYHKVDWKADKAEIVDMTLSSCLASYVGEATPLFRFVQTVCESENPKDAIAELRPAEIQEIVRERL